ncbi:MAG: DUF2642 domain-containing protein [Bacillus sp. (in: firmicutes)]
MHHSQHSNHNQTLPPGQYMYSKQFPETMKQLSPIYTVPAEPVFLDHLLMNIGKTVQIKTRDESLEGLLTGVAIDHLQLTVGNLNYHIRLQQIIYFIGKPSFL